MRQVDLFSGESKLPPETAPETAPEPRRPGSHGPAKRREGRPRSPQNTWHIAAEACGFELLPRSHYISKKGCADVKEEYTFTEPLCFNNHIGNLQLVGARRAARAGRVKQDPHGITCKACLARLRDCPALYNIAVQKLKDPNYQWKPPTS